MNISINKNRVSIEAFCDVPGCATLNTARTFVFFGQVKMSKQIWLAFSLGDLKTKKPLFSMFGNQNL